MKKLMFVIPFAGGSSASYACWKDISDYDFVYVDLPGKGMNQNQACIGNLLDMADECARIISAHLAGYNESEYYI